MNRNEIIVAAVSVFLIGIGLLAFEKNNRLKKKGKKAKAIIFKNNYKSGTNTHGTYHPVVRFLTEDNEWITQELDFGVSPAMPEGKEIEVIYNPSNPQEVIMNSDLQTIYIPWLLTVSGICGFVLCCLELLDITNFV